MKRRIGQDEDEIDRMLELQPRILPSAGFTSSLMKAIRLEAAAPPPILFPWKRALPGLAAGAFALALVVVVTVVAVRSSQPISAGSLSFSSFLSTVRIEERLQGAVSWTFLALVVTFLSVKLSMRLAASQA
jgi:hypothetical protein